MTSRPSVLLLLLRGGMLGRLPRLFSEAGAEVTLFCPRAHPMRQSRYVDAWMEAPAEVDPFVAAVRRDFPPAGLEHALVVVQDGDVFERLLNVPVVPSWLTYLQLPVRRALQSKTSFALWAHDHALPMPPARVCHTPEEAREWLAQTGPALMKRNYSGHGEGVRLVGTARDVKLAWQALGCPGEFLLQRFVSGRVGVTELVLRHGEVLAWQAFYKCAGHAWYGGYRARQPAHPRGMAALAQRFAAATGCHGLCGFDWIEPDDPGAPLTMIEVQPSATAGFGFWRQTGVDIPRALRALLDGSPAPPQAPWPAAQLAHAPLCCHFPAHLQHALQGHPRDLRYWLPGAHAVSWSGVPFDDPPLLLSLLAGYASRAFRRKRGGAADQTVRVAPAAPPAALAIFPLGAGETRAHVEGRREASTDTQGGA